MTNAARATAFWGGILTAILLLACAGGAPAQKPPAPDLPFATSPLEPVADTRRSVGAHGVSEGLTAVTEENTLLAIALGRASGVPLSIRDIGTVERAAVGDVRAAQAVDVPLGNVFSALTLGARAGESDLVGLMDRALAYRTSVVASLPADLDPQTTLEGLALYANGLFLDPRRLITKDDSVRVSGIGGAPTTIVAANDLPLGNALAGAALGMRAASPGQAAVAVSDVTLSHASSARTVYRPFFTEGAVLGALALANNGLPVEAEDALSGTWTRDSATRENAQRELEREDALAALVLLGASVATPA